MTKHEERTEIYTRARNAAQQELNDLIAEREQLELRLVKLRTLISRCQNAYNALSELLQTRGNLS